MMRILVVTSVFPNSVQPALGVFVRERMFAVARHCELKVVAPVPWFPFSGFLRAGYRPRVPFREVQDGIEIFHPRFFNFPGTFKCLDGVFFFLCTLLTALRLRRLFRFDLIDAHFAYPDGLGAVLLGKFFGTPVTITVRGTIHKLSSYLLRRRQIIYALRQAARVFTVCEDLKRIVTDLGIDEEHVEVVANGVNVDKFRPLDRDEARRELGLPLERKIIISVGGLVERKGFQHIIAALPDIAREVPGVMYVIVGGASVEGNFEPVLRQLVQKLGLEHDVIFAGVKSHDQLSLWLSAADIFCLATSNEGWANVFLEAMACGVPVVASRVGGNEEVVASPEVGMLFELSDRQGMVQSILAALRKQWRRDRIIEYARNNTWDRRVLQLMNRFGKIISQGALADPTTVMKRG